MDKHVINEYPMCDFYGPIPPKQSVDIKVKFKDGGKGKPTNPSNNLDDEHSGVDSDTWAQHSEASPPVDTPGLDQGLARLEPGAIPGLCSKVKITYRGWPGHFICGHRCAFRLNTLIEYKDKKIVVSTVGMMVDPLTNKYEPIGFDRHFETMAFYAKQDPLGFWDADVTKNVDFDSQWAWPALNQEQEANDGHIKVVQEVAEKLERGEL